MLIITGRYGYNFVLNLKGKNKVGYVLYTQTGLRGADVKMSGTLFLLFKSIFGTWYSRTMSIKEFNVKLAIDSRKPATQLEVRNFFSKLYEIQDDLMHC